ncbi:MAG: GyrI-like domain-containing protein [Reichenbachiella sp.]
MEKIDLKKIYPEHYKAKNKPQEVNIDAHNCLTISGMGAPERENFMQSIEAIYPVAFTVKKYSKTEGNDFVVPKLECFWWVEEGLEFNEETKNEWQWQLMIRMPDFVTNEHVDQAVEEVIRKKGMPFVNEVILQNINEGRSVQMMHTGSYYEEEGTIGEILEFMKNHGLEMNGYHHEIYISDPRKTAEEKLKTIIRYAVK